MVVGPSPFPAGLVAALRPLYLLEWGGIHGWEHWLRVRENGLALAAATGADPQVAELFALFHDIARCNDGHDPDHGRRAAGIVTLLAPQIDLDGRRNELLRAACAGHADGLVEGDVTVRTCWDADRLDLGRVGTVPRPELLCTDVARDPRVRKWAWDRSLGRRVAGGPIDGL